MAADAPDAYKVLAAKMPYLEAEYKKRADLFNGQPVWVMDRDDDVQCLYSDGERWKVCAYDEGDMAQGRGWFKGLEAHEGKLPHQVEDWLRPAIGDDEEEGTMVVAEDIYIVLPQVFTSVAFPIGTRVKVLESAAVLESLLEDVEVELPPATVAAIADKAGEVTGYHFDEYCALLKVTADDGEALPPLPCMALMPAPPAHCNRM
eukprot:TRINITY_DN28066_c0_g1_i1.p1 TRINITY_DN28066_c0_g1~~TRINITY_DN28066_c0_g1_i1.p1  ORF type:complete len:220 (+),score=104.02 TRINITY_DN28066_c0_g1_i1:50-661(+)